VDIERSLRTRELSDTDLVASFREGNTKAFRELVRRYQAKAYALALRLTSNEADAQEVLQDTFLSVYRKFDTFRGDAAFSSWLYRITANAALMKVRSRGQRKDISLDVTDPEEGEHIELRDWSDDAERLVMNRDAAQKIAKAVDQLPEKYRVVFLLREVEELSTQEVAEALGLSTPTVKTRLHRARLYLRNLLGKTLQDFPEANFSAKEKNSTEEVSLAEE
jgi:RNA polymerase sigma-70 factor (ECF subfamily)